MLGHEKKKMKKKKKRFNNMLNHRDYVKLLVTFFIEASRVKT